MESNKKQKFSFNFVDVILIAIILIAIFVLVKQVKDKKIVAELSEKKVSVEYTIVIPKLREDIRAYAVVGDGVTDISTGKFIGEISNISYSPYKNGQENPSASNYVTVTLTVNGSAVKKQSGYSINGTDLILQKDISIHTSQLEASGYINSVSVKSDSKIQ